MKRKEYIFLCLPVLLLLGVGYYFNAKRQAQARAKAEARAPYAIALSCSRDGQWCASAGKTEKIHVWNTRNKTQELTLPGHKKFEGHGTSLINALAFSPASQLLASAGDDGDIIVSSVATGELLRTMNHPDVRAASVLFSPAGKVLASQGVDGTIVLWDVKTGKLLRMLPISNHSLSRFSDDGATLTTLEWTLLLDDFDSTSKDTLTSCVLHQWQVKTGELIRKRNTRVLGAAGVFSPDSSLLCIFQRSYGKNAIVVLDAQTLKSRWKWLAQTRGPQQGGEDQRNCFAFSPNSQMLAVVEDGGKVNLFQSATGKHIRTETGFNCVAFTPNGKWLLTGGGKSKPIYWHNLNT